MFVCHHVCDLCGKKIPNVEDLKTSRVVLSFQLMKHLANQRGDVCNSFDLCPSCSKKVTDFLKKEAKESKKEKLINEFKRIETFEATKRLFPVIGVDKFEASTASLSDTESE